MQIRVLEDGSLHVVFQPEEHNTQIDVLTKLFEVFDENEDIQDAILAVADVVMGINRPLN
jgi:hypothetical protein